MLVLSTHSVLQRLAFEFCVLILPSPWVLGLQVCTTMPGLSGAGKLNLGLLARWAVLYQLVATLPFQSPYP